MEQKLKQIIDGTETIFAQEYLNKVVLNIASAIEMEYVFVARTNLENDISTTIAVARDGILSENFEYSLKDTPCEDVAKNSICSYEDNVAETFSKDKLLIDMKIKGYVGSPLHDSNKKVIGIMVALSTKPIDNSDSILSIMQVVSGRIAAELDRIDKEHELRKVNLELKALNETLEDRVKYATMDLHLAQKLSKIGSWRFNSKTNILKCSDQVYEILDINKDEHSISKLNDFFNVLRASNSQKVIDTYQEHIKNHEPYKVTHKIETDSGTKYIEKRCETTFDDNGDPLVSNGTIQDITEEIQRNHILIQQSRMAQMGEMIAMIAHQWRQPLGAIASTSIDLNMQMELETFDLKQEKGIEECQTYFRDGLKDIDSFVQNLTTTIDDFRNFYKPNKSSDLVSLCEPLEKALNIINGSLISDGIEVTESHNNCKQNNSSVKIYISEMVQVILNILKNAQDNFKEKKIKDPKIVITCKYIDSKVTLEICDNGGGIPEDVIPNIFDPYFSTKDEKNGTGLGLYMSKTIVDEHHNGNLLVNNRDNGVCFTIELLVGDKTGM